MTDAKPRGLYFEDFEVGMQFRTPARTLTQADIVNFACLSGDFNEVHCNWEYAKTTQFGQPVVHGPLVYAVAGGLQYASGINEGTLLALMGIDKWRMLKPVFHGDTIHMVQTVLTTKETNRPDRGIVTLRRDIRNQRDETVQEMEATLMYRRRQAQAADA